MGISSEAIKNLWKNPLYREKMIKSHIGKRLSDETKKKKSLSMMGKRHTDENEVNVENWEELCLNKINSLQIIDE